MISENSRHCTRCSRPLTDDASLLYGVGPSCRTYDDVLLRPVSSSNPEAAIACWDRLSPEEMPEQVQPALRSIGELVADPDCDWMQVLRLTEWVLSHQVSDLARATLCTLVECLGYGALVQRWLHQSSMEPVSLRFYRGRIVVKVPRGDRGVRDIQSLWGRQLHVMEGAWSVPASQYLPLVRIVKKRWPRAIGLEKTLQHVETWLSALKEPVTV